MSLDSSEVEQMVRAGVTKTGSTAGRANETSWRSCGRGLLPRRLEWSGKYWKSWSKPLGAFSPEQLRRMLAFGFFRCQHHRILEVANMNSMHLAENDFANLLATRVLPEDLDVIRSLALANLPVANEAALSKYAVWCSKDCDAQYLSSRES